MLQRTEKEYSRILVDARGRSGSAGWLAGWLDCFGTTPSPPAKPAPRKSPGLMWRNGSQHPYSPRTLPPRPVASRRVPNPPEALFAW